MTKYSLQIVLGIQLRLNLPFRKYSRKVQGVPAQYHLNLVEKALRNRTKFLNFMQMTLYTKYLSYLKNLKLNAKI